MEGPPMKEGEINVPRRASISTFTLLLLPPVDELLLPSERRFDMPRTWIRNMRIASSGCVGRDNNGLFVCWEEDDDDDAGGRSDAVRFASWAD